MKRMVGCVCALLVLAACDGSRPPPIAPTSTPPLPTPPPGATYTVFGEVRTGGVPVAGVMVAVLEQAYYVPVITDSNGRYSIRAASAQPWGLSPLLSASKPGYFTDTRFIDPNYAPISKDAQLDFEVEPLTYISLGDVVRRRVEGGRCAHWGYGAGSCARLAVTVPSAGTLEVTVTATIFDFDIDVIRPNGTFALYNPVWISPSRNQIAVEAGSTYQIRLAGRTPREFELTTALR